MEFGELQLRPLPLSEIHLECDKKKYHAAILNKRYIRARCTEKGCRREGFRTFHIWDGLTGRLVASDYVDGEGVTHREVVSDGNDSRG